MGRTLPGVQMRELRLREFSQLPKVMSQAVNLGPSDPSVCAPSDGGTGNGFEGEVALHLRSEG